MKTLKRCLLPSLAISLMTASAADADDQIVGVVLSITGPVYLAQKGGGEIQLNARKDFPKVVTDGQTLRCRASAKARLWINGETRIITKKDGAVHLRVDRLLTPTQKKIVEALDDYGRPGGSRGVTSLVWSPPDEGSVRPESFRLRWTVGAFEGPVHLNGTVESGEMLWSIEVSDGSKGASAEAETDLRRVLSKHQEEGNAQRIVLAITSDKRNGRVTFWLLSKQAERRLNEQLLQWNQQQDPLLRAILRAHTLNGALLYAEAAEELEAALMFAPESESLLTAAIEASLRIGNAVRAHELRDQLRAAQKGK